MAFSRLARTLTVLANKSEQSEPGEITWSHAVVAGLEPGGNVARAFSIRLLGTRALGLSGGAGAANGQKRCPG